MITIKEVAGGLEITRDEQDLEELQDQLNRAMTYSSDYEMAFLADLLEPWTANGSYAPVYPEWIGALTSAPIIASVLTYSEEGTPTVLPEDKVWWFPDYAVRSFAEELLKNGMVRFRAA